MLQAAAAAVGVPAAVPRDLVGALWPAAGGQDSLLTAGGYPAEFSFAAEPDRLRVTIDLGPGAAPAEKLARAQTAAGWCDIPDWVAGLAREPDQRFGSWLGLRFDAAGGVAFKIYQEVTAGAAARVRHALGSALDADVGPDLLNPSLVGIQLDTGDVEVYGRIPRARPSVLHSLFSRAGAAAVAPAVMDHLAALACLPRDGLAEGLRVGGSVRVGAVATAGLFVHTRDILPSNRAARARLEILMHDIGVELPSYRAACGAIGIDAISFNLHGLIGLSTRPDGGLTCSVGLRAPDERDVL